MKHRFLVATLLILFILSASLTWYLSDGYFKGVVQREADSFQLAQDSAIRVASRLNQELAVAKSLGDRLARDLGTGELSPYLLTHRIKTDVEENPVLFGIGAAYERGEYLSRIQLYAPFFRRDRTGQFAQIQIEDNYDYTDPTLPEAQWYIDALQEETGFWVEPYQNALIADLWLVDYYVPIHREIPGGRETIGVIFVTLSTDSLVEFLNSIDAGEEGFTYLLSDKGTYIIHPRGDFLRRSIFEKADELENDALRVLGQRVLGGEGFYIDGIDPASGQTVWTFHRPVLLNNWSIGIVFDKFIGQERPHIFVRDLILIALSLIVTITLLFALFLRVDRGRMRSLWGVSIVYGLLCLCCIGFIWYLEANFPQRDASQIVLVNSTVIEEQLASIDEAFHENNEEPPLRIPTGIMLETIAFNGGNNANDVSGYIWQRYPLELSEDIEQGFRFTDVIDGEGGQIEEIYRIQEYDEEVVGWFFRATLRQEPSVDKFPLDEATVQMQIWPKSLDSRVVLVPDLESYEFVTPSQNPGLVDVLVLENWEIVRSYFSYRYDSYNATFGSRRGVMRNYTPDLYFNTIINRVLLSALVSHAVTILVAICLMFAILIIKVGSSFEVLGYSASLFFVIAVSQVGLRGELEASGVVYLEYGYILLYVLILVVSVNSMLYYSDNPNRFIQYRDNLIPKLLYWPTVGTTLLIITLYIFLPPPEVITETIESATTAAESPDEAGGQITVSITATLTSVVADSTDLSTATVTETIATETTTTETVEPDLNASTEGDDTPSDSALESPLHTTPLITDPMAVINDDTNLQLNGSITVGLLNSMTGPMAVSETPVRNATLLAIAEINQSGGVLGKRVIPTMEDGASDWPTFAEKARKLLVEDEAVIIFGGWTSASRKAMLPVFEELNGLLFYPVQYEGMESSPNIFYFGAEPTQQILPAIDYLLDRDYKNIYLLGSDYIFPRIANAIVTTQLEAAGGTVAGEWYIPLGGMDFSDALKDIVTQKPDAILNTLNGDSNVAFFPLLNTVGYTAKELPVMSVSVSEPEIQVIGVENIVDHFTAWNYYQTLDSPENERFVAAYKAAYGQDAVTSDPVESAYISVYIWKAMVEAAGSTDVDLVRQIALTETIEYAAPGGPIRVDGESQHMYKTARIGIIRENGLIDEVWHSDGPIYPDPFLQGYDWSEGLAEDILQGLAEEKQAREAEKEQAARTLRIAIADYIPGVTDIWMEEQIIPEFQALYPDMTVQIENIFWNELDEELPTYFEQQSGPDIINLGPQHISLYGGQLLALDEPLGEWVELENFIPAALQGSSLGDQLLGLPWRSIPRALFCRTDLLEEAGIANPPTTFAEMIAMSKATTKTRNNAIVQQGFMAEEQLDNWLEYLTLLWSLGGKLRGADGSPTVASEEARSVLEFMYERRRAMFPDETINSLPELTDSRLATDEVVCYWGEIEDGPPVDERTLWRNISVMPGVTSTDYPESRPVVPVLNQWLGIPEYTVHEKEAVALLKILGSAEALNAYNANFKTIPPRRDAWNGFMEADVMQDMGRLTEEYGQGVLIAQAGVIARNILVTEVNAYFKDEQDIDTTLENMQQRYEQAILDAQSGG